MQPGTGPNQSGAQTPTMTSLDLEEPHHAQGPDAAENGMVSPDSGSSSVLLVSRVDGCVLPYLGGFGRYQKQLVLLTWIPALFIGFSQISDNFLLALPLRSACLNNGTDSNGTEPELSLSTTYIPTTTRTRTTTNPANSTAHLLNQLWTGNGTGKGSLWDNQEHCYCSTHTWNHELQSGLRHNVVTQWNLVCDSLWKVHIAKFSLLVGSIFGYLVLGVLADWFGRHSVLVVSVFFTLVFGMAVAFSVNVTMFSTLRFFEGFWLAGILLSLYVLRVELCLPGWRFSMTMVANFLLLAGKLLMPGLAVACSDWQILQLGMICPFLLLLSYIWLFPESLRWLLATQQYSRAKWLIERIIKKNRASQDSQELIAELNKVLKKKPKKTCIVKMVGTRNLWKNIVVLCVNSLAGVGINHCFARSMVDQGVQRVSMFQNFYTEYYIVEGINMASALALWPAVGFMGRRGGLLMFMIITALASLLQLGLLNLLGKYSVHLNIVESDTLNANFSVAFSIIGMFSSQAVTHLSIFFCSEITPTVIRGGGLGMVLASAGFGMLTAPIMELHNQKGYFLHHVIFACCTLICIICILLLPESRHQPLPESLSEGEGYTRHPLLPPHRKPAEQRHLLPELRTHRRVNEERSNDRADIRGTPLHEVAVSTVESTASSTVAIDEVADDLSDDLNAVRLSILKHRADSSPTRTDSLPGLIVNTPPSDTESPPPLHIKMNHCESPPTTDDSETPVDGLAGHPKPLTPPIKHISPPPTSSSPIDTSPLLCPPPISGSSPSEPQSPEEALVPSLDQTVTDSTPPFTMDSTISSPIDSAVDCTISTANGGPSPNPSPAPLASPISH